MSSFKPWRTAPRADPSESDIQKTCTQFLELDGWRALKTTPVSNRRRGDGFGELGMADHLYIRYELDSDRPRMIIDDVEMDEGPLAPVALVMWIEWKRLGKFSKRKNCWVPTKATPHQLKWIAAERARGALVLLAGEDFPATIEGFQEHYRRSGLMRGRL